MKVLRRRALQALVAALPALAGSGAWAHAHLQRSDPPANARIARLPAALKLQFSEALEPAFVTVRLLREGQEVQGLSAPEVDKDAKAVRLVLPAGIDPGAASYEVRWRIVARDGHPTEGRFSFRVAPR